MGNKTSANSKLIQSKREHTISIPIEGSLKPLFPHSIKWRCANPADFADINKLRPKLLSRINFSNNETQNAGGKGVRSLRRVLANAKRSSNIHIEDSRLNAKQLHTLLNSTNHLKTVKVYPTGHGLDSSHLSKSLIRIGRNKDLSELTVSYSNDEQGDETHRLRQQLKQLRKLEYMNLDLPFCKSEIILSLQPLRSLKSFGISFGPNPLIKQSRLPHLLSNLCKCDRFTELTLDFQHSGSIDPQETQLWTSFFQKAQSLKSFSLNISFSANQDFSGFQVFPECFKFMKHLTALRVHFNISAQQNGHDPIFFIDFFFDSFKYLPQLKKLEFTIDGSYIVKDAHLKNLVSALGCLKNLHSLEFDIRLAFSSEVFISLAKILKNFSNLKDFKLKFTDNKYSTLTSKAVKTFAKSLTHLQLKSLDLALSDQPIRLHNLIDKRDVPILSILSSMKNLSSLDLELSAFPPREWNNFYLSPKNLRELTSLSVVVGQFNFADNFKGLSRFMNFLKVMQNLTTLKLKLSGRIVYDQEVDLYVRDLDGCPNLHRLELTFQNADYLSEKALDSLQALVKLTKLEYLEMNLWRSRRFENNVVNKFLCGLIVLKRLKELAVNFERSRPDPSWKESVQKLKNCKYLTKVEINHVRYL